MIGLLLLALSVSQSPPWVHPCDRPVSSTIPHMTAGAAIAFGFCGEYEPLSFRTTTEKECRLYVDSQEVRLERVRPAAFVEGRPMVDLSDPTGRKAAQMGITGLYYYRLEPYTVPSTPGPHTVSIACNAGGGEYSWKSEPLASFIVDPQGTLPGPSMVIIRP